MTEQKKAVGRPASKTPVSDRPQSFTVSCTPNEKAKLTKKFGSLTLAIKSLLK